MENGINNWSYNPNYSELKKINKPEVTSPRRNAVFENKDGDLFVEIEKKANKQIFISRLLKGILPVTDVFEKNNRFYSKVISLDEFGYVEERKMINDLIILEYIFLDADHRIEKRDDSEGIGVNLNFKKDISKSKVKFYYI